MDHAANGGDCKFVMCAWDTCEKPGYEMYKFIQETGNTRDGYYSRPLTYIFCTERHRQYWIQSYKQAQANYAPEYMHGMLPKGYGNSL